MGIDDDENIKFQGGLIGLEDSGVLTLELGI
jgi:hypothetical protein